MALTTSMMGCLPNRRGWSCVLDEVSLLKAVSKEDWSNVRPEILGALFEHSLGQEERHLLAFTPCTSPDVYVKEI